MKINKDDVEDDKIIINTITDLLKLQIHKLNNSNLENISGAYFDKIYQEAINSENKEIEDTSSSNNILINKSKYKKKNTKGRKIKNNNELQKGARKKKSNINENKLNNNNIIIDKNDFYIEGSEMGIPEVEKEKYPQEKYSDNYKYIQNNENNSINIQNSQKIKIEKKTKIKKKNNNKNNAYRINNITPFPIDRQIYMHNQTETTPGHDFENKDIYNNVFYMATPTPNPEDEKEDKQKLFICPLNKIIFSIVYNSIFGEEVCILGSVPKLGLWKSSEALHLRWHSGNIWKGEINLQVDDLKDFEFKFVIIEKGKIKYWESGNNNIVNFTALINEFQFNKKGRYDKYEYDYNVNEGSLLIKCNWKK